MVGSSGVSIGWTCPKCARKVPLRIEACRCGEPRPAPVMPVAPAGHAPEGPPPRLAASEFDNSLRSPKEGTLFAIGVVFSALFWLMLVISLVGIFYGVIGVLVSLLAHALFLGHVRGNALRVSERQLPEVHAAVLRSASALGLGEAPEVYVMQAGGTLNAFATKLLSRRIVIIFSELVDACQDPRQLDFVIGHEVGHLAAGHLTWQALLWPFMLVPLLGAAYSRAREYTCDRCGLHVVADLEASMRGLVVLAAGGRQAARADLAAFIEQRLETGQLWSAVAELGSTHPFLCKRVAALQEVRDPGSMQPVGRNPFAYLLAPFLGVGGGVAGGGASLLVVVAIVGMIAAIAIPSLLRARVSANEAAAIGDVRSVIAASAAYQSVNRGLYDGRLECVAAPGSCIPGYVGPSLLEPSLANAQQKSGYRRSFHPGLRAAAAGASPTSVASYAYVAVPQAQGQSGGRSFCGDSSGIICSTSGGEPEVTNGLCVVGRGCTPLR